MRDVLIIVFLLIGTMGLWWALDAAEQRHRDRQDRW
jgi:hypothetical protein